MIKVFVRAIVPTQGNYLLMSEIDKEGKEIWDLPGGELKEGIDVKQYLKKLVLQTTGYTVRNLRFFEVVCRVKPRKQGALPATHIDFIFVSEVEDAAIQEPNNPIELLPFERFEWLDSGGRFRENKVMALLGQYHKQEFIGGETRLNINTDQT